MKGKCGVLDRLSRVSERFFGERVWWARYCLVLAISAGVLSPVLASPFVGDDAWNSLLVQRYFAFAHSSLWSAIVARNVSWATANGRFFPLSSYTMLLFYVVNGSAPLYKSFIVFLTLADIAVFGLLVERISRSRALGFAAMLVVPLTFQLVFGDDPLTSYQGLLQVVVILTEVSMLSWLAYLRSGKRGLLLASLGAWIASVFTYEIGFPFFIMFILLAWAFPRRRTLRDALILSWPWLAAASVIALVWMAVHAIVSLPLAATAGQNAYLPNLDPGAIVLTYARQVFAAFPFANTVGALAGWFKTPPLAHQAPSLAETFVRYPVESALLGLAGLTAFVLAGLGMAADARRNVASGRTMSLALTGASLLLLPGVLITLSTKYQSLVGWGFGYLPKYVSWFGFAMLAVLGFYVLARRLAEKPTVLAAISVCVAIVAAAGLVLALGVNANVSDSYRRSLVPLETLEVDGLKQGVMAPFPAGGTLFVRGDDWEVHPALFALYAGKQVGTLVSSHGSVDTRVLARASSSTQAGDGTQYAFDPGQIYMLDTSSPHNRTGWVVFGSAATIQVDGAGNYEASRLDPLVLYLSWDPADAPAGPSNQMIQAQLKALGVDQARWESLKSGPDWVLLGTQ
jgi:hypothetical protein